MMKPACRAWFFLYVATISTLLLCSTAMVPPGMRFLIRTSSSVSSYEGGGKAIHKTMGAQGGRGTSGGGGGSISDRPEAVKKSSGAELRITNLFTSLTLD
ncbi:unnamed protein product [Rhodiola kirilowii]